MAEWKKEFHYFVLTDFEREEQYLRDMHRQGWALDHASLPGLFYFRRCAPADVVYRMDFDPQKGRDAEAYRQMFRDYGWEYLQELNQFSYFRKTAGSGDDAIFSDRASQLAMLKRIFTHKMLPVLLIALLVLPGMLQGLGHAPNGVLEFLVWVMSSLIILADVWIIARCLAGFYRLGKKYQQ